MQLFLQTFACLAKGRKPLDTFFLPLLNLLRNFVWFLLETNLPELNRRSGKSSALPRLTDCTTLLLFFMVFLPVHTLRESSCITMKGHSWFSPNGWGVLCRKKLLTKTPS